MIDLASKYVLLYLVSLGSTMICSILWLSVIAIWGSDSLFVYFDITLNLVMLYFNFAFANPHYQRCCSCLDSRFRNLVSARTKQAIHRKSLSQAPPNMDRV